MAFWPANHSTSLPNMPSSKEASVIPGQTAPRVITNIKVADRRSRDPLERNPFTDPPRGYNEILDENRKNQRVGSCKHFWTTQTDQSVLPRQARGLKGAKYRIACFCQLCRWHVDITITLCQSSCPSEGEPLHHFARFVKMDKFQEWYEGRCTVCAAKLNIEYREPRLSTEDIALLTDTARLQKRLQIAREKDPDRPDLKVTQPVMVLDALATYIRDSLQPKETHREIPRLNRRFLLSFGEDCEPLLRKLHFVQTEETWQLPQPPPEDPWSADLRQYLQDVQEELWALMRVTMETGQQNRLKAYHETPPPFDNDIQLLLSTIEYDQSHFIRRATFIPVDEEQLHAGLGTVGEFPDELLIYAFNQQIKHDPAGTPYYYDCLAKLAEKRKSETLEIKVMMLASEGYFGREDVTKAYKYFSLDAWDAANYSDEYIRNTFEARLGSVQSWQETEMRQMLRVIAMSRGSKSLEESAADEKFRTASEAFKWLFDEADNAEAATDDIIQALASEKLEAAKVNGTVSDKDREKVMEAMTLIANHRDSSSLRNWIAAYKDGNSHSAFEDDDDLTRAFNHYNIQDRSGFVDMDVLQTMLTMKLQDSDASTTDKENSLKYFEIIKNSGSTRTANQDFAPIDHNSPVGLQNLGNTCYLNSLLQYFYAIKRFRDIVRNLDKHKLPLVDYPDLDQFGEVGGLKVSRAYARWAQQDFLPQLATLFNEMYTSSAAAQPDVKLARDFLVKLEQLDLPADNSPLPSSHADVKDASSSSAESDGGTSDTTLVGDVVLTPESDADEIKDIPMVDAPKDDRPTTSSDNGKKNMDSRNEIIRTERLKKAAEQVAQQQDVHEIANNLISKAVCAMNPSGDDWNGRERDEITKLFYSSFHENKRNSKEPPKVVVDNTVFVHLHDRPAGIPEGLEAACELDHVTQQYRTYVQPAPILQICFQNQEVVDGVRKIITHPFHVPLELNLIRYMDKPHEELLALRKQYWDLHRQIHDREEANGRLHTRLKDASGKTIDVEGSELFGASSQFLKSIRAEFGPDIDELDGLTSTLKTLSDECHTAIQEQKTEISAIDADLKKKSAELNDRARMIELTSESKVGDFDYTLFAVFVHCSRDGNPGHGHYYIYIRDFAGDKWRCYNDDNVTIEDGDINGWIHGKRQGDTGRPNLVVYVKTSDREKLTQPLHRKELDPADNTSVPAAASTVAAGTTNAGSDDYMHDHDAKDDSPPKVDDENSEPAFQAYQAEQIREQALLAEKAGLEARIAEGIAMQAERLEEFNADMVDTGRSIAQNMQAEQNNLEPGECETLASQFLKDDTATPDFQLWRCRSTQGRSRARRRWTRIRPVCCVWPRLAGDHSDEHGLYEVGSAQGQKPGFTSTGKELTRGEWSAAELQAPRKRAGEAAEHEDEPAAKLSKIIPEKTDPGFILPSNEFHRRKTSIPDGRLFSDTRHAAILQAEINARAQARDNRETVEADEKAGCRAEWAAKAATITSNSPRGGGQLDHSIPVTAAYDGTDDEPGRRRTLSAEVKVVMEFECAPPPDLSDPVIRNDGADDGPGGERAPDCDDFRPSKKRVDVIPSANGSFRVAANDACEVDYANDDLRSELSSGFSSTNSETDSASDGVADGIDEEGEAPKNGPEKYTEFDEGDERAEASLHTPQEMGDTNEIDEAEAPDDTSKKKALDSSPKFITITPLASPGIKMRTPTTAPSSHVSQRRRVTFVEPPKPTPSKERSDSETTEDAGEGAYGGLSHVYPFLRRKIVR